MRRALGFTLIEVLIALAVLGIALAAAARATLAVTDGSMALRRHLAGGWVAQNRIANYTAMNTLPDTGTNEGVATQAGLEFVWRETVSETPNKAFRRVEVRVYPPNDANHADAVLVSYVSQ
ncbi:type II secretion system minor pseudopilin GspI [Chitinimonas viridis]|uniref:Type II secretion system protein I n=1 Tax=Chitinimonas viridis TaxID=664880 RepID=A0ABT8B429_9NEIS|nr:type II secretion system minor pseudopilin GspI [Chitinimonas viridis]MDN3576298.1 type II secretion system minor pseudopilin GspI [Chitinimonas viridis]